MRINSKFNSDINNNWFIKYFKNFSKIRWIFFSGFIIFFIGFCMIIYQTIDWLKLNEIKYMSIKDDQKYPIYQTGWTILDKFTTQSNLILLVFSFFFVFFPKHQFLNKDKWLIATITYIFVTFCGYNFLLFPMSNFSYGKDAFAIISNIWWHIIDPLVFIVIGFLKFKFKPLQHSMKKFYLYLLPGMIYPTIYIIYLTTIPFVYQIIDENNNPITYTVYGIVTNTKDHPEIAWPIIAVVYFIFFPGVFAIFYYSEKSIQKKIKTWK